MAPSTSRGRLGRLAWRRLEPFGAEVEHDFRLPLNPDERAAFRELLFAHRLLVARGQSLSLAQQQDVAGHIGPVLRGERGMAYVAPDDGVLNDAALTFHSDLAFAPEPFTALSLHAVDVEDGQTATLFADAVRALETLPPALKAAITDRRAAFVQPERSDVRPMDKVEPSRTRPRLRSIILDHPTTGAPVLFVNEQHVERIDGLAPAESRALLEAVFAHLYAPANIFEHRWRMGDLLVWDNIGLQHGRGPVRGVSRRRLQRASVAERSLLEQVPDFFEVRGASM